MIYYVGPAGPTTPRGMDSFTEMMLLGFADLGMETIYEFDVVDMPVTVAVDAGGTSAHITGPAEWQKRIATGERKTITLESV